MARREERRPWSPAWIAQPPKGVLPPRIQDNKITRERRSRRCSSGLETAGDAAPRGVTGEVGGGDGAERGEMALQVVLRYF